MTQQHALFSADSPWIAAGRAHSHRESRFLSREIGAAV